IKRRSNFCWERKVFKREMGRVQSLRNDLTHAKDYAVTRKARRPRRMANRIRRRFLTRRGCRGKRAVGLPPGASPDRSGEAGPVRNIGQGPFLARRAPWLGYATAPRRRTLGSTG